MKLIENINQNRRDFKGKYQCEFCDNIEIDENMNSYDDDNYYENVIPNRKCNKCQKSTISENGNIDRVATKYPQHFIV